MSIDKNSTGIPEVNVHRPTTKVNLAMIAGVALFLVGAAAIAFWTSRQAKTPATEPPPAAEKRAP